MALLAVAALVAVGAVAVYLARPPGHPRPAAAVQDNQVQRPSSRTVVSLTFDDAYVDQWRYGVPLLRSHHMNATFYVITADSDRPYPCCMSWAQLRVLQAAGDDIGSHTIDHPRLTALPRPRIRQEVCGSRRDMVKNGIRHPVSFAYPYGSFNTVEERIVRQCGFTNARQGGGISGSGTTPAPPWAETLPPRDPQAVSTIAVDGEKPMRLADLQNFVTQAAAHGGGWLPITFHNVCNVYASDYIQCMASYGPVQDTVLGHFLDWLARAGHPGGAPRGVIVQTMREAMNTRGHAAAGH